MDRVVGHARKVGTVVGLRNVAAHNAREGVYDQYLRPLGQLPPWISHPERAGLNQGDRIPPDAVLKQRGDRIKDANLTRKPQKNASSAVEIVISGSPEWFNSHTPSQWMGYFKDARTFLGERFGSQNVLSWNVHCDEKTPHMHVLFVPIRETAKGNAYTSSQFLGGKNGLREFQDQLYAKVGKKFGMERGVEGSKARHTDQYQWAAQITDRAEHVIERETAVVAREKAFLALSKVPLEPFKPDLQPKKPVSFIWHYCTSDGQELDYKDYVRTETILQRQKHAEKAMEIAQAKEYALQQELQKAKKLEPAEERIRTLEAERRQLAALSPEQLRKWADQKEKEIKKTQQKGIERDNGGWER